MEEIMGFGLIAIYLAFQAFGVFCIVLAVRKAIKENRDGNQ